MTDRVDSVWEYGVSLGTGFTCKYCKITRKGGGAHQLKQHLVGRCGNVIPYNCIPPDVRDFFCCDLDRTVEKKKERVRESLRREEVAAKGNMVHEVDDDDEEELQHVLNLFQEEDAYSRWVRDQGEGIACPSGTELDCTYLDENKANIKKPFEKFKLDWPTYGITVTRDSWTESMGMNAINFMIYCNGIIFFHKSVDATGYSQDAKFLYRNSIRDCMENERSNAETILDEESTKSDMPFPAWMVVDKDTPIELQRITGSSSLVQ